jgi:hypothetical protein
MTMVELLSCAEWKGPIVALTPLNLKGNSEAARDQILKLLGDHVKAMP